MSAALAVQVSSKKLQAKPRNDGLNDLRNGLGVVHGQSCVVREKDGANLLTFAPAKYGKVLSAQQVRDETRKRIAAGLRLALESGQFTKQQLCEVADLDRKTLDNWINEHCDTMSWKLAAVSQLLGQWFFMYVYGGEVGLALFQRLQDRIADATDPRHMDADFAAIAADVIGVPAGED